jgi:nucleoside-diphosphate-sugar epimerase
MSRVLIAGCGYVGTALGLELAARGDEVWGIRRDPSGLPPAIRPLRGDLLEPDTLVRVLPDAPDVVVYAASAGGFSDHAYRSAYVDGVRSFLRALVQSGAAPRRVLFTSSTGVYGRTDGEWVDEDTPPEPTAFNGSRVLEGEDLFLDGPFPAVVLRLGGIYGPGRTSLLERVRQGGVTCPENPVWSNRIHRDDCAGALLHLIDLPEPDPVYIGVDREPADLCQVMTWLAGRVGAPEPVREVGGSMGRGSNKRCSSDRLANSGYSFRFPDFRSGFEAILAGEGAPSGG